MESHESNNGRERASAGSQAGAPAALDGSASEPIAIIGLSCRFPQADSPAAFWRLMRDGVDAITEVPPDRFDIDAYYDPTPAAPGKIVTRYGGFLDQVDKFDAFFFGISPREAAHMDPQQRLLMELAWEATEDAGLLPEESQGLRAGVFVGMITNDYEDIQFRDPEGVNIYAATGGFRSVASGRLSYMLGWQGPSLTVDTACSSSLVALHLACQSLRSGECAVAMAAGVNLILQPEHSLGFSNAKMLAPDGRCKFCDASGDGFVRSEGAGVLVLKPLSKALADGDRVHAVIRGSAVNNDGRTSGFLMTPGQEGQKDVLRAAYRDAGVAPGLVQYVEAHGTGTSVGDPTEVKALGAVLSEGRAPGEECLLGSVKTNIGHTEGAAGIAGIIKVVLSLKHGLVPASLHFRDPNPSIPWGELPFSVPRQLTPWPRRPGRALAGVSSFGISGTNAHIVLEEAPPPSPREGSPEEEEEAARVLTLSAHGGEALRSLAARYKEFLAGEDSAGVSLTEVCYTAAVKRAHHEHRLAVVARSRGEAAERLDAFLQGEARPGMSHGEARAAGGGARKVAFVFPGQGSQWFGMGRGLLGREPVFRESIERCEASLRKFVDWSLLEQLTAAPERSRLQEIDVIQPTLFSIQVALAALWRSRGVEPDAVVGHSMGEVAAAHVAGILSLDDAAKVICRRSRLLKRVSGRGAMALVELPLEEAARLLEGYDTRLSVAVSNSPSSTVLSGEPAALEEVLGRLRAQEVFCRPVKVDVASHSPQMDALRPDLLEALGDLRPRPAAVPLYSTVGGGADGAPAFDAAYWARNLREPVLFSAATQRLLKDGHEIFIEISPNPILLPAIQQVLRHVGREGVALPSMRHEEDEQVVMLGSLGALHVEGQRVDWPRLFPAGGPPVALPTYGWQRERFWVEGGEDGEDGRPLRRSKRGGAGDSSHTLVGRHLRPALNSGTHYWEAQLSTDELPYLKDHRVRESIVLPAAAYVEMALAAAGEVFGPGAHTLRSFAFRKALFLTEGEAQEIQLSATVGRPGEASFQVLSRAAGTADAGRAEWTLHATGTLRAGEAAGAQDLGGERLSPEAIRAQFQEGVSGEQHYRALSERGLNYGAAFQGVSQVWRQPGEALGLLRPAGGRPGAYRVHPALLDAAFQIFASALGGDAEPDRQDTYLPVALEEFRLSEPPPADAELWSHISLRDATGGREGSDTVEGDVRLLAGDGRVLAEARGLRLQRLERDAEDEAANDVSEWLYEVSWHAKPRAANGHASPSGAREGGGWLILADGAGAGAKLRSLLEGRGERCALALAGAAYRAAGEGLYEVNPSSPEDFRRLWRDVAAEGPSAPRDILHLWSLNVARPGETSEETLEAARALHSLSTLHLLQAVSATDGGEAPRLWLVTAGAQAVKPDASEEVSFAQAPLWGLGRVIANEHAELRCTLIDLSRESDAAELEALAGELSGEEFEPEVALRGEARYVARLTRCQAEAADSSAAQAATKRVRAAFGQQPYRLEIPTPGILDNLTLRATERAAPGPGRVELQVYATGLNFRDVMLAMGVLPPVSEGGPIDLGWECAGVVTAVGEGVEGFRPGDEVLAVAPPCFGAFATTSAFLVVPKPPRLSFEEAASIPIIFLTAFYALHHLGRMRRGERVLIHAAAGGVGLAAIQIARLAGAEVYATAGAPEKRDFLRALGVRHVYDSRTLAFAEEVMRDTGGEGVDLVLNSLAGEAIPRSLAVLGPHGRFLELGKADILQNTQLGLSLFQNNVSFFAIDLSQMFLKRPEVCGELFREVMPYFERGDFEPVPRKVFPVGEVADAFRFLGQAKHVGKVVISMEGRDVLVAAAPEAPRDLDPEGAYLITGGLGGLGLSFARWMVERGARNLVLMGRGGASEAARETIAELERAGARVLVARADVARREQLAGALAEAGRSMPPLKGVVHAAGLLADGVLLQQDAGRFESVMAPKVAGAWNLHSLTLGAPLDFFVLFSSVATLLGSPGQGNYSAANAFLDALAHYRRARGLPALSINWGPWSEVGLAARPDRGGRLAHRGLNSMTPEQGVSVFGPLLRQGRAQVGVMPFDYAQWARFYPASAASPFFAELAVGGPAEPQAEPADGGLRASLLAEEAGPRRRSLLESYLREQVAHVLKLSPARVDTHKPFGAYGLDSLMALEFRNRLEAGLNLKLSATMVWNHPTVAALAPHVASKLGVELEAPAPAAAGDADGDAAFEALLDELKEMPSAEVSRIIAEGA